MAIYSCKWCKENFSAREADRKRGWALFCSKSCKAKNQESKTGQYKKFISKPKKRYPNTGIFCYANYSKEELDCNNM